METSLYDYMKQRTWDLTEDWYAALDKSKDGVYSVSDPEQISALKEQNHQFHLVYCELFNTKKDHLTEKFEAWVVAITSDQAHLQTPIPQIIDEFLNVQEQYLQLVREYAQTQQVTFDQYDAWNKQVTSSFQKIIVEFSERSKANADKLYQAQQDIITELSSPVILLNANIALLPLVGEIDTYRSKVILDSTLNQCVENQVDALLIDLSGVPIVDTMVANQLFQLIEALNLVGTKASLSGVRPEIAQTSIQLGINFGKINIYSSISRALQELNF
ncbi:STAS domain-containing protein [Aureibacillus halotolerans]|uniref:RsbT co-antagonist protein RsbR n=1 Tax=Aureibacillus halotolerans TaxID=1508390 RepID=A0A4R6U3R8_9BACI|nr:STAS domain-containing protein [Aureibacillus halotolerans]TDQ40681.1 rsbT co-antagonist protein RsbR [Aureibacillus halotolerans]